VPQGVDVLLRSPPQPATSMTVSGHRLRPGEPWNDADRKIQFNRVGKHAAGRLLDGRTWDEMPASPAAPIKESL
jgi:hypothetical protein